MKIYAADEIFIIFVTSSQQQIQLSSRVAESNSGDFLHIITLSI